MWSPNLMATHLFAHLDRTGDPEQQHAYARQLPFVYPRHLHVAETLPSPEAAVSAPASREAMAVRAEAQREAEQRAAERAAELAAEILAAEARPVGRPRSPQPDGVDVEPMQSGEAASP